MSGHDLRIRRREAARRRCFPRPEQPWPLIFGDPAAPQKSALIQAISTNRLARKRWTRYLATGEGPLPKGWFGPFRAGPSALDIRHRSDPLTSGGRLWMVQSMQLRRGHVLVRVRPLEGGHLATREAITFLDTNGITWEITGGGRVTGSDQNRTPAIRDLRWKHPVVWIVDDCVDASGLATRLLTPGIWDEHTGDLARSRIVTISQSKIHRLELLSGDGRTFDLTAGLAGDVTMRMPEFPRPANPRLAKIAAWSGAQGVAGDDVVPKTWHAAQPNPLTAPGLERAIQLVESVETRPARMAAAVARFAAVRASAVREAASRHTSATP